MRYFLTCALAALVLILGCATKTWQIPDGEAPRFAQVTAVQYEAEIEQEPDQSEEEPPQEAQPAAQAPKPEVKSQPQAQAAAPQAKQEEKREEKTEEEKLIFTKDGRLMHPWYKAPEIKDFDGPKPSWFGESLKFKIGWSFITAGEASVITNKIVQTPKGPAFVASAYAQSYTVIDKMFKVRDINASWIATDISRSLGYWQSVREGGYKRDEWVVFDHENKSVTVNRQSNKGDLSRVTFPFQSENPWDMLSSLYYIRGKELPLKGEVFFDAINNDKEYPLKVVVHGKETVKTAAGKFDCILVEPFFAGPGIFVSKGKSLKVWVTDDKYKMPVKMSVEVFIGSVYAELVSYSRNN